MAASIYRYISKIKPKRKLHLFLFHDDIEEFLVVAHSRTDSFKVIEEEYGDGADDLILAHLDAYPDGFRFKKGGTAGSLAKTICDGCRGFLRGEPGSFVHPKGRKK